MERIRLHLTTAFPFSTEIAIRITDLNYGGHVGNDAILSLVHEARQQFLQAYGYKELDVEGAGLIMIDAALEYKQELLYGDILRISVAAVAFDKIGFDLHYLVEVKRHDQYVVAAKVKTGMLCFDYALKKKVPVPEAAYAKLSVRV